MNSTDRMHTAGWISTAIAILGVTFMVGSCDMRNKETRAKVEQACIAKGGDWVLVGSGSRYGCKIR